MKTWEEIIKEREAYLAKRQLLLRSKVSRLQSDAWLLVSNLLGELNVENGEYKNTIKNKRLARRGVKAIFQYLKQLINKTFVEWLISSAKRIFGFNNRHFKSIGVEIKETLDERVQRLVMERLGYDLVKNEVIEDSWLDALTGQEKVKLDILKSVSDAIGSRISIADFRKQFRDQFTGKNGLGAIEKYFYLNTHDLFLSVERTYQYEVAKRAGLKHFIFHGQIIKRTRDWCRRRKGIIFTVDILDEWIKQDWAGKKQNHNMILDLGGFGCIDSFSFISEGLANIMLERLGIELNSLATISKVA